MNAIRNTLIVASISLLSACVSWPSEGEGGYAEHYDKNLISVEYNQQRQDNYGLRFDYSLIKNQLSLLKLQGAYYCFPASVDTADRLENRIARELSGGLYDSATANIIKQRLALRQIEHKLEMVLDQEKCVPPTEQTYRTKRRALIELLNSDNQFAINSSELNQKYKHNLDLASTFLRQSSPYKILIVGSTDAEGDEDYNLKLSRSRAVQVRDYLIDAGVKHHSINIIASGEFSPVYDGRSDAVKLINRNVRIYVIEG